MGVVGIVLLLVFAMKAGLGIWANKRIFSMAGRIEVKLRVELLRRYQAMPYQAWAARNSSDYINAINVWAPQYARLVLMSLLRLSAEALVACLILTFLFWVDPLAFVVLLALITSVTLLYDRILRKKNRVYADRFRVVSSLVITDVRQAMDGIKEIRVLGAEEFFSDRIARNGEELCSAQASSNTISSSSRYFLEFAVVVFAALVPLVVAGTGGRTVDLVPVLAIFGAGTMRLVTLFSLTTSTLTQLGFYRQVVHSLFKDLKQEIPNSRREVFDHSFGNFSYISARKLGFSYSSAPAPVLNDVDFTIKYGDKIVLLGASGSGKSTLVDLLLGILQPNRGSIEVTDISGRLLGHSAAPYSVYLPQSTFLIDDTVRRNVALGQNDAQIDEALVRDALQRTRLWEVVEALPQGLDTPVGDRGLRLSGGQRQRIAIARAFYLGKTVLFLDEATSAIDAKTEEAIVDDLLSSSDELTVVLITHRVEIAHRFDRIYRVEHGNVREVTDEFKKNIPIV
jgi:ATP-binding cassette subfamily C protein